jgi:hypothetical protein
MIFLPSSIDKPMSPSNKPSQLFSMQTCFRQMSTNSFLPSIVIVHSTATVTSSNKAMVMNRPVLTNRRQPQPKLPVSLAVPRRRAVRGAQLIEGREWRPAWHALGADWRDCLAGRRKEHSPRIEHAPDLVNGLLKGRLARFR